MSHVQEFQFIRRHVHELIDSLDDEKRSGNIFFVVVRTSSYKRRRTSLVRSSSSSSSSSLSDALPGNRSNMSLHRSELFIGSVARRTEDVHHVGHQLAGIAVHDETSHLLVSWHVRFHADAQQDVTRDPMHLVTVTWYQSNIQNQTGRGTDNSATIRELECPRHPDVEIPSASSDARLPDRFDVHHHCTCTRVVAVSNPFSISSHHTFYIDTSDSTSTRLECRKSSSRTG